MKQLVWLDLCSGLGGASQPALDRGWKVIRVDIDPRFKPDIVADVRALPLKPFHVDVLWASPPCQQFSHHGFGPRMAMAVDEPDTSIVRACMNWAKMADWWCVENVWAAGKFLTPIFKRQATRVPGHLLWHHLPCLIPNTKHHKGGRWQGPEQERRLRLKRQSGLPDDYPLTRDEMPALRAKIPYEIGEAICAAVERRVADE